MEQLKQLNAFRLDAEANFDELQQIRDRYMNSIGRVDAKMDDYYNLADALQEKLRQAIKMGDNELVHELAKERVKIRVSEGGHNIEPKVIERRYIRGIQNLFDIYLPIVDGALIFDNSEGKHELIVDKQIDGLLNIVNEKKFNLLKNQYDNT